MGQIKHYNNGKWTIYTSGEGLSGYTGYSNTYYIGADLDNNGNLSKANPDGSLVNLEINLIPKTWSEMVTLSNGNSLIQGRNYLITDFQTKTVILNTGEIVYGSPYGTLWNVDGWADLSDYTTRTYRDWAEESGYYPPSYVGTEAIMFDIINNKYYKVMFSQWTQGGAGGGFAYTRTEILSPTTFGTPVNFTHTNYGTEVDYIDEGISITRGVNQGIFNETYENSYLKAGYYFGGEYTVGPIEPIIVQAINNNSVSNRVLSTVYPEDEILYGLKDLMQGATKGRIQFRKDTKLVISTYYDWRVVKFRRWFDTTSNVYNVLTDNGQASNDYLTFNNIQKTNTTEIPLNYNDYPTLNNVVIFDECFHNNIGEGFFKNSTFYRFYKNNIKCSDFYSNYFQYFINNEINCDTFRNNGSYLGSTPYFEYNQINCDRFESNMITTFRKNKIFSEIFSNVNPGNGGAVFSDNELNIKNCKNLTYVNFSLNKIFSDAFTFNNFYQNFKQNIINVITFTLSNIYGNFTDNFINGYEFYDTDTQGNFFGNVINAQIRNSNIGADFNNNKINQTIISCIIQNGFTYNIVNTTLSGNLLTPVNLYEPAYTKTIFANRNGQVFLTYLNNTNTPVYVSVP